MPSEMVIASKFRNAQYFEENELRVTHEKKQTNKQTYKKQYNYLLQSLEVCLISEVTMKTADSFSQSSTKSLQYPNSATGGQEPAANQRITITLSIRLVKSFYLTIILQRSK